MFILDFDNDVLKILEEESYKDNNFNFNIYVGNNSHIPTVYSNKILSAKVSERRRFFKPVTSPSLRPIHIITKWLDEDFYPLKLKDSVLVIDNKTCELFKLSKIKIREL